MLALQHARDNREFYGRRYSRRELLWEAVSTEVTEDYYEVRLSYCPGAGFRGEPGVKQITVDKTGPIEFRQIIIQPQPSSRRVAYVLAFAVVLAATAAALGGLIASGALTIAGDASTPLTTSVSITPGGVLMKGPLQGTR